MTDSIPLLHNGDAYSIEVEQVASTIHLRDLILYPDNKNAPKQVRFFDLDHSTREAVLSQIRRRYKQYTIKVS